MAEKELQQLQIIVEYLLQDRTTRLADLDHTYKSITAEIKEVKSKIIEILDKLEQQSLNVVNKFMFDLREKFKSELQCLNKNKAEMLELISKITKPNIDDALLFARLKQSKALIKDRKQNIFDIAKTRPEEKVRFVADTKLLECTKSLQGPGLLIIDTHDKQHTNAKGKESNIVQVQGHVRLKLNQPYTVGQKTGVSVKVKGDKATCLISGMCQLPGGNIIVSDFINMSLKQLDSTYKVTSHCPLSGSPYNMCNTEEGEVAVALDFNTIQLVSVKDKLTVTRSLSTSHACCRLTYHNKCLYVITGYGSTVYVYKPSGSVQRIICTDQHGTGLFFKTNYITVSPVSERLYVADGDSGLVTVDLQGNLLATLNSS